MWMTMNDVTTPTFRLSDVPRNFALCLNADCPLAGQCLHHIVKTMIPEDELILHVYNPEAVKGGEDCKYFRNQTPVRYAYGFEGMQAHMLPGQYAMFMDILIAHFSRNSYFVRRRGEFPMPPKEQELIREVLKQVGADPSMEFDRYKERINWTD